MKCVRCDSVINKRYYTLGNDVYCSNCAKDIGLDYQEKDFSCPLGLIILTVFTHLFFLGILIYWIYTTTIYASRIDSNYGLSVYLIKYGWLVIVAVYILIAILWASCIMLINHLINTAKCAYYLEHIYNRLDVVYRIERNDI